MKSMKNNLIPPFMMREAGIVVNNAPKIHSRPPTVEDHFIYFPSTNLRITMVLNGIFSSFITRKPMEDDKHSAHAQHLQLGPTL